MSLLATNDFQRLVNADGGTFRHLIRGALAKCSLLKALDYLSAEAQNHQTMLRQLSIDLCGVLVTHDGAQHMMLSVV